MGEANPLLPDERIANTPLHESYLIQSGFIDNGNEWKTRPLWGIGLTETANPAAGFLHDDRAKTVEEGILWHGGEAQQTTEKFLVLNVNEREQRVSFVMSL